VALTVEPSLYAADFWDLGAQIEELLDAGATVSTTTSATGISSRR
jgi:pentose-5-phosphate-3-epimerase